MKTTVAGIRKGDALSYLLVVAITLGAGTARAATNTTWVDDPDNRGTEDSPINLYDKNKWESGALPSATYNINFIAGGLTYVTNTASATTQMLVIR